jgi:hypothetical protein
VADEFARELAGPAGGWPPRGQLRGPIVKGFSTTDVPLEFCLLQGEIAEAFDAWRKGRQDLGEELADGRRGRE